MTLHRSAHTEEDLEPASRGAAHASGGQRREAPKLRSFIDELRELEARVCSSRAMIPNHAREVRDRLELAAWARTREQELQERDLGYRVRCRKERQAAARGWIAVVAQGVGVVAMAVAAAIGASTAAGDHRVAIGACAAAGAGACAGYLRRQTGRRTSGRDAD